MSSDSEPTKVYVLARWHQEGKDSIVGVYATEEMAKEVYRVVSAYAHQDTFSIVAAIVQEPK